MHDRKKETPGNKWLQACFKLHATPTCKLIKGNSDIPNHEPQCDAFHSRMHSLGFILRGLDLTYKQIGTKPCKSDTSITVRRAGSVVVGKNCASQAQWLLDAFHTRVVYDDDVTLHVVCSRRTRSWNGAMTGVISYMEHVAQKERKQRMKLFEINVYYMCRWVSFSAGTVHSPVIYVLLCSAPFYLTILR